MLNSTIIEKCVFVSEQCCSYEIFKSYIKDCSCVKELIWFKSSNDALSYINANPNNVNLLITDVPMFHIRDINQIKYPLSVIIIIGQDDYSSSINIFKSNINTFWLNKPFFLEEFKVAFKKAYNNHILEKLFDSKNQIMKKYNALSCREREILDMIALNYKNQKIADLLFISVKTVETTKINICQKLGIDNCQSLSIFAYNKAFLSNL